MQIQCFLTFELVTWEPRANTLYGLDIDEFNGPCFFFLTLSRSIPCQSAAAFMC